MSAMHGAIHLARRGVEAAHARFQAASPEYIAQLQHDAALYDQAGSENKLRPEQFLPVLITGFLVLLIVSSIDYTIGSLMATLSMIESPSSTAIVEPKQAPPPYADEPDAPLEKEPLMPYEAMADTDVEVTVIKHKPITATIPGTIHHLHQIGGFRARWRGLGFYMVYHVLHAITTNFLGGLFGFGIIGHSIMYIVTSVALARFHMHWTHAMIAAPSTKSLRSRMVPRKQCKAILLPALVYAVAQQATFIVPVAIAFAFNLPELHKQQFQHAAGDRQNCHMAGLALKVLAVPVSALIISLAVLLPAAVTLTRIEATLLPEDMSTVVPFDREAIVGDIDTSVRGGCRALFVQAWRSFDNSARLRLVMLYAKCAFAQFVVVFVGAHLMIGEIYLIGGEKLAIFFKSAHAQLKLMAIEAQKAQAQAN